MKKMLPLVFLMLIFLPSGCKSTQGLTVEQAQTQMAGLARTAEELGVEVYAHLQAKPRVGLFTESSFGAPGGLDIFLRVVPKGLEESE